MTASILIVEDQRVVARDIEEHLVRLGYSTAGVTASGDQAVRLAGELRPDLVLMDIRLEGGLDGVAAAGQIRERFGLPVVYLTAYADPETLERAKVTEPFGYVLKPFEERELRGVIEMALYKHRAERRLRESERRYAVTLSSIGDAVIATDERGRVTFMNPAAGALTGWPPAEAVGRPIGEVFRIVNEHTRQPVEDPALKALRCGAVVGLANRTVLLARDGRELPIDDCGAPIVDDHRAVTGAVLVFRDVTDRRRAEAELRGSHDLLNAVVEGTSDAVFVKDPRGRYLLVNSAAARLLGRPAAAIVGADDRELLPAAAARAAADRDRRVLSSGESQTLEEPEAGGAGRTYLTTRSPFRDARGEVAGLVGIARDVTELKWLEQQYLQAQKMEAVGRLAGGVAHDFNNLLTVINGYAELLFGRLRADDPAGGPLAAILHAGERAATLTRQLLAFSRKQLLQPRVVGLNALLGELIKLLRRLIGEDIELALVAGPGPGRAKVDPGQFEQAVINLAVNARDAMPRGGRLTIETRTADLADGAARRPPEVAPGRYVLVTVSDTGHGMDEATRGRIFEPFFTTKEVGKGTGLGLAMVYGFVKQSGGHIEVDSEPGRGTTFRIYLPHAEADAAAEPPADPRAAPPGTETVLLVEDESAVRTLSHLVLQGSGYTVLEAGDGQEGLAVARAHPGPIHLLVTDLVMPRVSGRQLADELLRARPGLRVLFMSGYTDEVMLAHGVGEAGGAFLQKPFSPSGLAQKVREVLDQRG